MAKELFRSRRELMIPSFIGVTHLPGKTSPSPAPASP